MLISMALGISIFCSVIAYLDYGIFRKKIPEKDTDLQDRLTREPTLAANAAKMTPHNYALLWACNNFPFIVTGFIAWLLAAALTPFSIGGQLSLLLSGLFLVAAVHCLWVQYSYYLYYKKQVWPYLVSYKGPVKQLTVDQLDALSTS